MPQELIFSNDVCRAVDAAVDALEGVEGVFVLVDGNTGRLALPLLAAAMLTACCRRLSWRCL